MAFFIFYVLKTRTLHDFCRLRLKEVITMTNELKQMIKNLSEEGYGYKAIASKLNISVGSVRNVLSNIKNQERCKFCDWC